MSAPRPPGGDDDDRELTSGDSLRGPEGDDAPAPPPPPWQRPAPAESPGESWRPYPEDGEDAETEQPAAEQPPASPEPDLQPAPPPVPWERAAPPEAVEAFGTEPPPAAQDGFGREPEPEPEPYPEPEPEPLPDPEPPPPAPREPRTGSVGPPGYEAPGQGTVIPPGATVPPRTPAAPAPLPGGRHVLAPWGRRAAAFIVDGIVVGVIATLVIVLITAAAGGVGFLGGDATGYGGIVVGLLFSTLIATAVALLYAPIYMVRTNGQTLGKQLLGIRVIRAKGQPVDFLWSVLREVIVKTLLIGGIASSFTFGLAFVLDCLWPLWDDENRALHDMIVDSRVVRA